MEEREADCFDTAFDDLWFAGREVAETIVVAVPTVADGTGPLGEFCAMAADDS